MPVVLEAVCDDARRALGVPATVQNATQQALPEGCYISQGVQALFSQKSTIAGNGAGTIVDGGRVTEICMSFMAQTPAQDGGPEPTKDAELSNWAARASQP